jgi:hypothetical protein
MMGFCSYDTSRCVAVINMIVYWPIINKRRLEYYELCAEITCNLNSQKWLYLSDFAYSFVGNQKAFNLKSVAARASSVM